MRAVWSGYRCALSVCAHPPVRDDGWHRCARTAQRCHQLAAQASGGDTDKDGPITNQRELIWLAQHAGKRQGWQTLQAGQQDFVITHSLLCRAGLGRVGAHTGQVRGAPVRGGDLKHSQRQRRHIGADVTGLQV